jgi:hypothetical protein
VLCRKDMILHGMNSYLVQLLSEFAEFANLSLNTCCVKAESKKARQRPREKKAVYVSHRFAVSKPTKASSAIQFALSNLQPAIRHHLTVSCTQASECTNLPHQPAPASPAKRVVSMSASCKSLSPRNQTANQTLNPSQPLPSNRTLQLDGDESVPGT